MTSEIKTLHELPATMKAAVLLGQGGPDMLEVQTGIPLPTVADDEVLIEVAACGMNSTDINTRVGWYSRNVTGAITVEAMAEAEEGDAAWSRDAMGYPRIQGADPSGRVVAVGSDTHSALLGRRVLCDGWIRDPDEPSDRYLAGYLGIDRDGGFAQYCAVPAVNVYPHDSPFTDIELASFPCSWSTAEHMLHRVRLTEGQSIAIPGASGGVGSALVSLARLRGAKITAVTGSTKMDAIKALGADAVVSRDSDDPVAAAVAANGGPFDVVADIVGGADFPNWLEALRRGGRYTTAGAVAGPVVSLDLRTLYLNDLEFYGATIYEPAVFANLMSHIREQRVQPVVGGVYPLEEIGEAQAAFGRKEHVGAIVIDLKASVT